ncbi:MAG: 6-bladed beta-propeller [Bacteroidota bacterium]|nr:6-bladed beta-propeller [Bacteroidota bacterium]
MRIVIRKCFWIMIVSVLLLPSCKESLQSDSTMSFDVDGSGVNIMSSELFDTISYLPLETTKEGLIGIMQKMRFSDSRYYFLTGYNNEKIIAFDKKSGEHLLTIDRNGRGPGEYVRATEFFVEKVYWPPSTSDIITHYY